LAGLKVHDWRESALDGHGAALSPQGQRRPGDLCCGLMFDGLPLPRASRGQTCLSGRRSGVAAQAASRHAQNAGAEAVGL